MSDSPEGAPAPAATTPVLVSPSPLSTQLDTAVGQGVQAVGGLVLAYGLLTPQHWAAWAAAAPIFISAAWRIWAATRHHAQLFAVANDPRTPDAVAKVIK